MKKSKTPPEPKPSVHPVRRVSPRIGRVYAWSPRPVRSPRYASALWVPSVEYTLANIRDFCARWN